MGRRMTKRVEAQPDAVKLTGQVYKVQTLVDGGIRVTLDFSESAADSLGALAKLQLFGIAVDVEIKPNTT